MSTCNDRSCHTAFQSLLGCMEAFIAALAGSIVVAKMRRQDASFLEKELPLRQQAYEGVELAFRLWTEGADGPGDVAEPTAHSPAVLEATDGTPAPCPAPPLGAVTVNLVNAVDPVPDGVRRRNRAVATLVGAKYIPRAKGPSLHTIPFCLEAVLARGGLATHEQVLHYILEKAPRYRRGIPTLEWQFCYRRGWVSDNMELWIITPKGEDMLKKFEHEGCTHPLL